MKRDSNAAAGRRPWLALFGVICLLLALPASAVFAVLPLLRRVSPRLAALVILPVAGAALLPVSVSGPG